MSPTPRTQTSKNRLESSDAIYLLGFSPKTNDRIRSQITSVFEMIECCSRGNVDCWYVRVPRDQFEGESAEKNLADLKWLSPRVMAHQRAVEWLSGELPFYPTKFGTLFSSWEPLFDLVEANRRTLASYFADEARHVEWGIKCFVSWPRAVDAFQRDQTHASSQGSGGGLNYLRRKQMIRQRNEEVRDWLQSTLVELRDELNQLTYRCCDRPTHTVPAEGDWECVANLALLLDPSHHAILQQWVESKNTHAAPDQRLLTLQLTGPWPLYSFVPSLLPAESAAVAEVA